MVRQPTELEKKKALKLNHHKKIDYALAKAFIHDNDLYELIEDFFREYLDLKYEFTHEELTKELDKMFIRDQLKQKIIAFLDRIAFLQFNAQEKPSQEELRALILGFKEIINGLISFEETHPQTFLEQLEYHWKNFMQKMRGKKKEEPAEQEEKQEPEQETAPQQDARLDLSQLGDDLPQNRSTERMHPLERLKLLLRQINDALTQNNLPEARRQYTELVKLYNTAPAQVKQQYYHDIQVLYMQLK